MEFSGPTWTMRFPTSKKLGDLESNFRSQVRRFLDALADADAEITIAATRRPRQRAYLMHYSWLIVRRRIAPEKVPPFKKSRPDEPGVDIGWVHLDRDTKPSAALSVSGALQMVQRFNIATLGVPPSLSSLHLDGKAIDMSISWDDDLVIRNASGKVITIKSTPRSGANADLIRVGASYGVIHLHAADKDPPHWSVNGH
jgi:hypothetical protein